MTLKKIPLMISLTINRTKKMSPSCLINLVIVKVLGIFQVKSISQAKARRIKIKSQVKDLENQSQSTKTLKRIINLHQSSLSLLPTETQMIINSSLKNLQVLLNILQIKKMMMKIHSLTKSQTPKKLKLVLRSNQITIIKNITHPTLNPRTSQLFF